MSPTPMTPARRRQVTVSATRSHSRGPEMMRPRHECEPRRERCKDALGLASSVTIGVASAAPACSLAAVPAVLSGAVGVQAPAAILLAFIPMVCIAAAYDAFDRVAPMPEAYSPGLGARPARAPAG
jgi:hypothetical protein